MKWQTWSDKGIPLNPPMYSPSWTFRCTWRQPRGYSEVGWVQIFSSHRAHVDVGAADRELGWCPVSQTLHHHLLSHPAGLVFPFKSLSESSPPNLLRFFDREVLPRAGGSITDVRITPEGTGAADTNAHMLHNVQWKTFPQILLYGTDAVCCFAHQKQKPHYLTIVDFHPRSAKVSD